MDDFKFNVPVISQANSRICWLACYQMLYGWASRSRSEPVDRARSAGLSLSSGLDSTDWGTARDAMGLTSYRVGYLKESEGNLLDILRKCGPMWCAGNFLQGSGHAIVISGYVNGNLRISDPYEFYNHPGSYNWLTFSGWRTLVKELPFACQVWF